MCVFNIKFVATFIFTFLAMSLGGVGILRFLEKFDAECAFKLKHKNLILLGLYYLGCSYAVATISGTYLQVIACLIFMILGTEGYVDLQTSCTYILQTIVLLVVAVVGFLPMFINGSIVDHVFAKCDGLSKAIADTFQFHDASVIGFLLSVIGIMYFLSVIKAIAVGDVFILVGTALLYLCKDEFSDQRFFICLLASYASYTCIYLVRFIKDKIQKKEKMWGKRYPFTAPIAFGTLVGFLIF